MSKEEKYIELKREIRATLEGESNSITKYSVIATMIFKKFEDRFNWVGFYLVDEIIQGSELALGPHQGELGCLRISFGTGVCGGVAETRQTEIVENVHCRPGHIVCDERTNSEIVLPVIDKNGKLVGVLDIDSPELGAFDKVDKRFLEEIISEAL